MTLGAQVLWPYAQPHTMVTIRVRATSGTFLSLLFADLCIMTQQNNSIFDPLMNWKTARVITKAEEQGMGHTCTKYSCPESTHT